MQKHTKQLIAAVALLLIAAVPLALHIANADPTDEAVASAAVSSSEEQAEVPVSSAASAADSTREPEPQPEEEPDASSEEADSSAESGDASASSSEAAASSKPAAHSAASSHAASSKPAAHSAASSHAASSSHSAASSHAASSSSSSSTSALSGSSHTTETTDAKVNAYVRRLRNLQKRSSKKLYQTASSAYSEYMEHPVEERNLALKVSIVLGKTMELTKLQSECDKEFQEIVTELRQYLRENGYDQSIADAAEKEYKEEKDAMIKELTNVTYSQVTGKGEGGKWLQEHADMGQ
jgi:cytoskeletal protein RodZ